MAKDKCPECKCAVPEYMATYGDLVTLLMCFFVLLFAFSSIDAQKFEAVMQSFQGSAGVLEGGKSLSEAPFVFDAMPENTQESSETVVDQDKLEALKQQVEQYISENSMEAEVDVQLEAKGLVIRFKDNVLFDSGSAVIKTAAVDILVFLGDLLNSDEFMNEQIRVEGHTDNVPIRTVLYPTNWELSTHRASNVVKFFIESAQMKPDRLSASGYGEYHPISTNETSEGRAANRRVDIVVIKSMGETTETAEGTGGQ